MIKRTALALTLVALLGTSALADLAAAHQRANSHHSKPWVYESKRPALKVSITRRGQPRSPRRRLPHRVAAPTVNTSRWASA